MRLTFPIRIFSFLTAVLLAGCSLRLPATPETPLVIVEVISSPKTSRIKVEFSGYSYEQSIKVLILYICFDLPEKETWFLDDVVFKIEDVNIPRGFLSFDPNEDGLNCQGIQYAIDSIPDLGEAELSIGQVSTYYIKDMSTCDKVQKELDEAKTGIVFRCDLNSSGVVSGFEILEKLKSMSELEAQRRVGNEFLSTIQVDWKFEFLIRKP